MEQFNQFMIKNAIQNILIKLILLLSSIGIIEFLSKTLSFSHLYYQALIGLVAFLFLVYFVFYYDSINNKLKKYFVFSSDADLHAIPVYAGVFVILRNLCVWDTALLVTIFVIIIPVVFSLFVGGSSKEQQEKNLLKDIPISSKKSDELGRNDFINTVAKIIKLCKGSGNRLLLDGEWGSGKTSIVNCVEETIKSETENLYYFAHVNPWSNETRDKFVETLLSVVDEFCKETNPSFFVSKGLFDNLLTNVTSFSVGYFGVQFGPKKEDLSKEIKELSQKLAYKREKLVLVIDDLDRLTKMQILDILSVIYLFSECNNIVFLLVANSVKVEEILAESKNACAGNLEYNPYGATSYVGYLEKMCSNQIKIPDSLPEFLKQACLKRLNDVLLELSLSKLTSQEEESLPICCFNNMRSIKRVLQTFKNSLSQPRIPGEVNNFHLLLVTILWVLFPKVSKSMKERIVYWQETDKHSSETANTEDFKQYFKTLFSFYPENYDVLETIFFILNPNYRHYLYSIGIENKAISRHAASLSLQYPISSDSVVDKAFYSPRYTSRYFCQNFSTDIIPDSILDKLLCSDLEEIPISIGVDRLFAFLQRNRDSINSFFEYVEYKRPPIPHRTLLLILLASAGMTNIGLDCNENKSIVERIVGILKTEIFTPEEITSVVEKMNDLVYKYWFYVNYRSHHEKVDFLIHILQQQTITATEAMEKGYRNATTRFVWAWERNFEREIIPSRTEDIITLLKNNEKYFWFLIGDSLLEQSKSSLPINEDLPFGGKEKVVEIITALAKKSDIMRPIDLQYLLVYLHHNETHK